MSQHPQSGRITPYLTEEITDPEQIQIQIITPPVPPLVSRVTRKAIYFTVGAIIEPQEPRYSAICVLISLAFAFACGMLVKKCF